MSKLSDSAIGPNSSDGDKEWVSSDIHEKAVTAKDPMELKAVYKQWSDTFEEEMIQNNLTSYKSVTQKTMEWLKKESMKIQQPGARNTHEDAIFKVIDVGCGTGLLGQHFKEVVVRARNAFGLGEIFLAGTDLSPEMLQISASKNCFDELKVSNLKEGMAFQNESFDLIISAGLFLPGHCGPNDVPNMLAILKVGGWAVFTVRETFYKAHHSMFQDALKKSCCDLVEAVLMPYYGEIYAYVLVVKKMSIP